MASSLLKGLNLTKIVSGVNNTIGVVNKAIPIYKQVTPIVKNVRSAFKSVSSIKEAAKDAEVKEIKSMERPITNFKKVKNRSERGEFNLDTLTFFQ